MPGCAFVYLSKEDYFVMSRTGRVTLAAFVVAVVGLLGLVVPVSASPSLPSGWPAAIGPSLAPANGSTSICVGPNETTFDGGCIGGFNGEQLSYMAWNGTSNDTFDFWFDQLVEITPGNSVVAESNLLYPLPETSSVSNTPTETNFTAHLVDFVNNTTGNWNMNDPLGAGWPQGNQDLGNVNVTVDFHVVHSGTARWEIKFDFKEAGWPWLSHNDHLGLLLGAHAPVRSTPTYFPGNRTLVYFDNATRASLGGFNYAGNATAAGPDSPLGVGVAAGSSYPPNPLGHATTMVMLNFTGGPGGYSSLTYDPWVLFPAVHATKSGGGNPPTLPSTTYPLYDIVVGVVALVAVIVVVFAVDWNKYRGRSTGGPDEPHSASPRGPIRPTGGSGATPTPIEREREGSPAPGNSDGPGYVW